MEEKEYTCIVCPLSCQISLKANDGEIIDITGYTCKRGENFVRNEYINPVRTLTTVVKLESSNYNCLPVISDGGIPKDKLSECLEELKNVTIVPPIKMGDIVVKNLLKTNVNIISAKTINERG